MQQLLKERSKEDLFVKAYTDYHEALFRRSFFKVSDKDLADDLVQVAFLKTWEYLVRAGKIESMKAFLFHALNDLIVDQYRKKKTVSLDVLTENGFEIVTDDSPRLINRIDGKTAMRHIPLLPEKYRAVMSMRFIQLLSLQEISDATGQTKNTVAVQIHRGIEKLAILSRLE